MNKQDIIDYVLKTPLNTNPAVLDTMLNELSGGGSDGDSDFSTATVTVVGDDLNAVVPSVITTEMGAPFDALAVVMQTMANSSQVPLYKGKLIIEIDYEVTVSGNIESLGNRLYLITGDCTINLERRA